MPLNRKLIDYEISPKNENAIKLTAARVCDEQGLNPRQKKIIQLLSFAGLIGVCIIFLVVGFLVYRFGHEGIRIRQFAIICAFGLILGFFIYWAIYKLMAKKAIARIDETEVVTQWFKYLDVDDVNANRNIDNINPQYKKFILKARNGEIGRYSRAVTFTYKNIKTTIVFSSSSSGKFISYIWALFSTSRENRETNDLWIFQEGFSKKWDGFEFRLANHIKGSKNELMNEEFERKFGIQTKDEIKKRMLLTPATQELINKKWKLDAVTISKNKDFMVTHSEVCFIDKKFNPWKFKSQKIKNMKIQDEFNKEKRLSKFNNRYSQFIFWKLSVMTYLLGHTYLLFTITGDRGTTPNWNERKRRHHFMPDSVRAHQIATIADGVAGVFQILELFG